MIVTLNRAPYICPVIGDSEGTTKKQYLFGIDYIGFEFDIEILNEESDR